MAYCGPRGIPLSAFLAWPEADQEAALAWQAHADAACPGCGTRSDDWDEAAGGHRQAWIAQAARCPGCAAVERMHEQVEDAPGVRVRLIRREAVIRGHAHD